jgi:hypothetical protein
LFNVLKHLILLIVLHCNENPIYVFLFWELRGHSPNFHIHESESDLFILTIDLPILLQEICMWTDPWEYMNRSQTHECGNWD